MKSTIRNFTTAFFAGFISSILLVIYICSQAPADSIDRKFLFLVVSFIVMGICTSAAFLGFMLLSLLSNIFNWSESKDFLLKIVFSITLYVPLFFLMRGNTMIPEFWYWSLTGTLAIITFDYKHLFSAHFSFGNKRIQTENQ